MVAPAAVSHTKCELAIELCRKMLPMLSKGVIGFDEYAFNLARALLPTCERCMVNYVNGLPSELLPKLFSSLRGYLEAVDFMPSPDHLIAGTATESEIQRKKEELRPKYLQLFETVRDRVAGVS